MMRLVLAAVLALLLAACSKPVPFTLIDITGAAFARDFSLNDHHGKPRTLADYRGRVVWIFFGFTHCPDICPTMMSQLALAHKKLGADAERVQVLFVTVDPERDTQPLLAQYVPAFNPSFVGLYGTAEQTAAVAREFKVTYEKAASSDASFYSVNHSSQLFVIDAQGRPRLIYTSANSVDSLVADTRRLLQEP